MVGKLTDPVASEAMSGFRKSELPRDCGSRPRPPVENCTIMPGQWVRMPLHTLPKRSGSEEGVSSSLRTWICARVAPASKASLVLSICSVGVIGTARLSFLRGTEPVIATVTTTGVMDFPQCRPARTFNGELLMRFVFVVHGTRRSNHSAWQPLHL